MSRRVESQGSRQTVEPSEPTGAVLSTRAFWIVFAGAWSAYGALSGSMMVIEGESPTAALIGAMAVVAPLILPAIGLALHRKEFVAQRASLARFALHKAAWGVAYGLTVAALGSLMIWLTPLQPMQDLGVGPWVIARTWFLLALFLYTVFVIFLMWVDALERVQESRSLAAQEVVLRAQAEAKALRAQFNPHFVFNTLHSLILLIRKDPDTAERAIEDVAALIRYASTLQRREVDQVPLGKEVEFAKRYLALEALRLADRLRVEWRVEERLEDLLVPAFSLQTLLENSIKHGISPKPEGGTVQIAASLQGDHLILGVSDDGAGADPALVDGNGGSGLHLLRSRLAFVYDGTADLAWQTAPGEGFRATLRLPVRRASEGERETE